MADDDYIDDATELVIAIPKGPRRPLDDEATNPLQRAAPQEIRERFEQQGFASDEATVERDALDLDDLVLDLGLDPDATTERGGYDGEDRTVLQAVEVPKPAPSAPRGVPPRSTRSASQLQPRASRPSIGLPEPTVEASLSPPPQPRPASPPVPPRPSGAHPRGSRPSAAHPPTARPPAARPPAGAEPAPPASASLGEMLAAAAVSRSGPVAEGPRLEPQNTEEQLRKLGLTRRKRPNANNIRPNSGFYSLPEANAEMTIEGTAIIVETNRDALGLGVAIASGVLTAVGLLAMALSRWTSPGAMMAWTLLGMVLCAGITAGVVLPANEIRLSGVRRAFMPMGVAVALVLIAGLAWQVGLIRKQLRTFAPGDALTARKVLTDRADNVALSECVKLAPRYEIGEWRGVLIEGLAGRPELTRACLDELDPDVSKGLSASLADHWHRKLLEGTLSDDDTCDTADSLGALDRPAGEIETRLLSCVLSGPTPSTQSCCGRTLAQFVARDENKWVASKRTDGDGYVPSDDTAAGLMTLAFHQNNVTPSQMEFVKAAKFNDAEARTMALSFACDSLRGGASDLAPHFAASLGDDCPIDVANVPRSRELWIAVCDVAEDRVVRRRTEPSKALCEATKEALVGEAVADASRIFANAAKDRTANRDMAIAIDVEANTTRGPALQSVYKNMEAMNQKRAAKEKAARAAPSFKPDW